jgi:hypothetical protein
MARWKLACNHYLHTVKPAKWRYQHTDRASGENIEKEFIVPRFLDINDPKCWTTRYGGIPVSRGGSDNTTEGEVIVCRGKGEPGDIEFIGDPTPDMLPQDEEAEAISASFQDRWAYKPEPMDPGYSQAIVDKVDHTEKPVVIPGLAELVAMIAEQTKQNQEIIKSFVRRV